MTGNVWLCCVLFSFAVYLTTEASAYVQFDGDLRKSNSSNDDLLKGSSPGNEGCKSTDDGCKRRPSSEEPKISRVPLGPRETRSIDSSANTVNENEGNAKENKPVKDLVTSTASPTASNVPDTQPKSTKKGHKKLKLAQSKPGHKKSKNKGRSRDHEEGNLTEMTRRHIGSVVSEEEAAGHENRIIPRQVNKRDSLMFQFQRNRDDDYYARRRAVMERFYNRTHEIEKKYQRRMSATTQAIERYDLLPMLRSTVFPSIRSTRLNTPRGPNETDRTCLDGDTSIDPEGCEEYYDESEEESTTTTPATTTTTPSTTTTTTTSTPATTTTTPLPSVINSNTVYELGQCRGQTHSAFYQQNFSLNVFKGLETETDLRASIGPGYCVTCIRLELLTKVKSGVAVTVLADDHVKLKLMGSENEHLTLNARFFAVRKTNGHC